MTNTTALLNTKTMITTVPRRESPQHPLLSYENLPDGAFVLVKPADALKPVLARFVRPGYGEECGRGHLILLEDDLPWAWCRAPYEGLPPLVALVSKAEIKITLDDRVQM